MDELHHTDSSLFSCNYSNIKKNKAVIFPYNVLLVGWKRNKLEIVYMASLKKKERKEADVELWGFFCSTVKRQTLSQK